MATQRDDPRFAAHARLCAKDAPYSYEARLVAFVLFSRMRELRGGAWACWPSVATIRRDAGGSRPFVKKPIGEKRVQKAISELLGTTGSPPLLLRTYPKSSTTRAGKTIPHRSPRYELVSDPGALAAARDAARDAAFSPEPKGFQGFERLERSRREKQPVTPVRSETLPRPAPAAAEMPDTSAQVVDDEEARKRRMRDWSQQEQKKWMGGRI